MPEDGDGEGLWQVLACPFCLGSLARTAGGARCGSCGESYGRAPTGQLDLRLTRPKPMTLDVVLGPQPASPPPEVRLDPSPSPHVDWGSFPLPPSVSRTFASYLPRAEEAGALALDLACGEGVARPLLEHAGYRYTGIDYENPRSPLLADAHALPFADATFDLLLSVAALQYFRYPGTAMGEAFRVLEPGGVFLGGAGFLTPFLPGTYFHHTHLGLQAILEGAGFQVRMLLASRDWTVLEASALMGLFPRLPEWMARALVSPIKALHRVWWSVGNRLADRPLTEAERVLRIAADIGFVAVKPAVGGGGREPGEQAVRAAGEGPVARAERRQVGAGRAAPGAHAVTYS